MYPTMESSCLHSIQLAFCESFLENEAMSTFVDRAGENIESNLHKTSKESSALSRSCVNTRVSISNIESEIFFLRYLSLDGASAYSQNI